MLEERLGVLYNEKTNKTCMYQYQYLHQLERVRKYRHVGKNLLSCIPDNNIPTILSEKFKDACIRATKEYLRIKALMTVKTF